MAPPKLCTKCGRYPKTRRSSVHCYWCWVARQPIELQVEHAQWRLSQHKGEHRARVPKSEWPDGERWCAGCQSFVSDGYARGSRCRACASQARHASHVAATYTRPDGQPFTEADYQKLLKAQGGRCYICGRRAEKRLAVDHCHASGEVRGLLCSSPDWGCNLKVVAILEGAADPVESARRLLGYLSGDTPARLLLSSG